MNITNRKPFSPGEILYEEFMQPLSLTQNHLAELLKLPPNQINDIIHGERAITPDTAIRLSRLFGNSADYWLNLQHKTDLWLALHDQEKNIEYQMIQPINSIAL